MSGRNRRMKRQIARFVRMDATCTRMARRYPERAHRFWNVEMVAAGTALEVRDLRARAVAAVLAARRVLRHS